MNSKGGIEGSSKNYDSKEEGYCEEEKSHNQQVILDHLCCKICYEPYQERGPQEPRVMKCGHSVCFQCIGFIYEKRSGMVCPFCNCAVHGQPKTLPKNFDIIGMIPHYPKLPANQKPYNLVVEKMKVQYTSEKAFIANLKMNSEQANLLVTQTMQHLAQLRRHADTVATQLQQAEKSLTATEDSLRLFVDLHPEDPMMIALAEQLPKPTANRNTILESIRQRKEINHATGSGSGITVPPTARNFMQELSQLHQLHRHSSSVPPATMQSTSTPPPPPPRTPLTYFAEQYRIRSRPNTTFAESIATAAARMQQLNSPHNNEEEEVMELVDTPLPMRMREVHSAREMMLSLIRQGGEVN